MSPFKTLAPGVLVAAQIDPSRMAEVAALGVTCIVGNRPDGEDPGQPTSAVIQAAAQAVGLDFVHAPVIGFPDDTAIAAVAAVLERGEPVLMYCRSGMRSAATWALAVTRAGTATPDAARTAAAAAGYDLSRVPL